MTKSPTKTPQGFSNPEASGSRSTSVGIGNAGQPMPPASSVTTSHTPKPLGGSGTEQMRRTTDKAPETRTEGPRSATDTARDAAEQVKERAGELYEQASERAGELYERATDFAHDVYERGARALPEMRRYSRPVEDFANENPVLIGIVGLVAGLLIGAVWPRTREDYRRRQWADNTRDFQMRSVSGASRRGHEFGEGSLREDDARFSGREPERRGEQHSG